MVLRLEGLEKDSCLFFRSSPRSEHRQTEGDANDKAATYV